jgi:putative ABC transport system ATP-binding protein
VTGAPVLEARGLTLDYAEGPRHLRALEAVDVTVGSGEFVGIVGPSGSGKSSLLFLLAGLRAPTAGEVRFDGRPVPSDAGRGATLRRRRIGFVFQEPFLLPYLTVRENALVHAVDAAAAGRVEAHARTIGLSGLLDERPHRLSGGERQRGSVLRALANDPDLLLADEPTAFLDRATGRGVIAALRGDGGRRSLVVVTHDLEMLEGADRVLRLRDGRLEP